ncbi:type IV pilus assembly protein PilV [Alteromonadaceae bacterium Bs31]|nr:type IV pilus assembly protein PilV [Alteromonadaceae bacterium Bs31]
MSLIQQKIPTINSSSGFSLIEVLVSFLVLAAGLLGVASMQTKGVENSHGAYLRTQAVSMSQDMSSRIRGNSEGVDLGSYNSPKAASKASCLSTGCSAEEMAGHDFFEWETEVAQVLPQGEGIVCLDSTPDDGDDAASHECDGAGTELVIKIWWDGQLKDGKVDQRYSIPVRL